MKSDKLKTKIAFFIVAAVKKKHKALFSTARKKCMKENHDNVQRICDAYAGAENDSM